MHDQTGSEKSVGCENLCQTALAVGSGGFALGKIWHSSNVAKVLRVRKEASDPIIHSLHSVMPSARLGNFWELDAFFLFFLHFPTPF